MKPLRSSLMVIWVALATAACDKESGSSACRSAAECEGGKACINGTCVACTNSMAGCPCDAGACTGGLVCDAGASTCRQSLACAEAGCVEHQLCQDSTPGFDAVCLPECEVGWYYNSATKACDTSPPACAAGASHSILADCEAQDRECIETGNGAYCGGCKPGFVEIGGQCETRVTCVDLNCAAQHRGCEELPNGHCTDCSVGWLEDPHTGDCRQPVRCADIACDAGDICVEPYEEADAFCQTGTTCGANAIFDPINDICHGCPPCNNLGRGEDGPYLDHLTGQGKCICRTVAGYFWREDTLPGVTPCDFDGDGWVRRTAYFAINSSSTAILENARCTLRVATAIMLRNAAGDELTLDVSAAPLELYEPERNDDQGLLEQAVAVGDLPDVGPLVRALVDEELNALTKVCAGDRADFNGNGLADVEEFHESVSPRFNDMLPYGYFVELYRGGFVASADNPRVGTYVIEEKPRRVAPDNAAVQIGYDPHDGDYWAQCTRDIDTEYAIQVGAGGELTTFDFARHGGDISAGSSWRGMTHHSQFKCVKLVGSLAGRAPHLVDQTAAATAEDFQLSTCVPSVSEPPLPAWETVNPFDPVMSCTRVAPADYATLANDTVLWAAVRYDHYTTKGGYNRGCVNECETIGYTCPGSESGRSICEGDAANFGELFCGCGYNYGGSNCDIGCPGDHTDGTVTVSNLFVQASGFRLAPRTGYWMCGRPSATAYTDPTRPYLEDASSSWKLTGEVPMMPPSDGARICQNPPACTSGYTLR